MVSKERSKNKANTYQTGALAAIFSVLLVFLGATIISGGKLAGWINDTAASIVANLFNERPLVPQGLSATQYYQLGLDYKGRGWVELARQALTQATEKAPESASGKNAAIFINIALPRNPVTLDAERRNILAFNLMQQGKGLEACREFRALIKDYPAFEWPYGNLASMYLEENNIEEAAPLISKALEANPCYLNGLRYKANLEERRHDYAAARKTLEKAMILLDGATDSQFLLPTRDEIALELNRLQ